MIVLSAGIVSVTVLVILAIDAVRQDEGSSENNPSFTGRDRFLESACDLPPDWVRYIERGWDPGRARDWDLILVPHEYNYFGSGGYTSHAGPYSYLQRVPLIFYGPGFIEAQGSVEIGREVTVADLAPTEAALLGLDLGDRAGAIIPGTLRPFGRPPRLIVTVSIDGGGWNVLDRWPAAWPNIRRLAAEGTSVTNAVVGSSPSITPPAHTSMSTGFFPREHGVTGIGVRDDDGTIVGGFAQNPGTGGAAVADPTVTLEKTTLADVWDRATENEAQIALVASGNYPLGMLGSGAALPGGDKDIAALSAQGGTWGTNPRFYALPGYVNTALPGPKGDIEATDRADGELDGRWRGHDIPLEGSPALAPWQTRVVKAIVARENFGRDGVTDLLYIHYKAPDIAGHLWNMLAIEQADVLRSVDEAIGDLVASLGRRVGESRYVLVITADHGQTPLGRGSGIDADELKADVTKAFDHRDNDVTIVQRTSPSSLFMNRAEMKRNSVTPEEVASYLTPYTVGDNIPRGAPRRSAEENRVSDRLFAGVLPGRSLSRVVQCSSEPAGS